MLRSRSRRLVAALAASLIAATGLVAVGPAPDAKAATTVRYAGADRYATSVEISKWSSWPGDTVFLASGTSFPDALAAGPVAAAENAHLLLTTRDSVPASVMAELHRLQPSEVVLVGDRNAIADSVNWQLYDELEVQVTRIAGANRVETSLALLDRLRESGPISEIWVVSGWNFPDALVAGSIAGRNGGGIVLDWHGSSARDIEQWRQQTMPYYAGIPVRIAGSGASVSDYDQQIIAWSGASEVRRFAGSDRYETARVIHDTFSTSVPSSTMVLATGQNFPDALGGSVFAAIRDVPLYLTPTHCHDAIAAMLRGERDQRGIQTVIGLGGVPSLSERSLHLEGCPPPPPPPAQPGPRPPAGPAPSGDVDCGDFATQAQAQAWFNFYFPAYGDIAGLDRDRDGRACESLP
ncbi:MAG: cell wall-binding repeat-containing protein [Actinomycetota bacterium]